MFETVPAWVADYIGIPFTEKGRDWSGCDCWGLVRLVYLEHYGIEMPLYLDGYESTKDGESVSKVIHYAEKQFDKWEQVKTPVPGDFVVCRIQDRPWHVGLIVAPGIMLHSEIGIESTLAQINGLRWKNRIEGYYRYHG